MKFYDTNTVLNFGIYRGKTINEVAGINYSYIDWCSTNLYYFYIGEGALEQLKAKYPNFLISEKAKGKLAEKYQIWANEQQSSSEEEEQEFYMDDESDYYEKSDYERDTFDALTDGQYGGYDEWRGGGGDLDHLMDGLGF